MACILILNDEQDLLDICQMILESAGHQAATQWYALSGLDMAKRLRPDLIVLDMVMPQLSGADVLRQLRADPQTAAIPVLMMSALADGDERAKTLGADDFLAKPFGAEELLAAVERMLQRAPAEQRPQPAA